MEWLVTANGFGWLCTSISCTVKGCRLQISFGHSAVFALAFGEDTRQFGIGMVGVSEC